MIGWLIPLGLASIVWLVLARFGGLPRSAREAVGAALFLGIAGYAWQGSPGLPGRPTPARAEAPPGDSLFAQTRGTLTEKLGGDAQVLDTADAFHRQGLDAYSIGIIKGALARRPQSAELWVGLGNALVLYTDGAISPAAELAFRRAKALDPQHPGPDFFRGLALAQSGRLDEAVATWRALVARAPADARWKPEVSAQLARLEALAAGRVPVERQASDAAAGSPAVDATDPLTGTPR